jgi:hypothetical protein
MPAPTQVLDWDARIFLFHNFLSPEECDHIISLSEKRMTRSGVVQTESGGSAISEIRTSYGVFLDRAQDPVITGECTALQLCRRWCCEHLSGGLADAWLEQCCP